MLEITGVVKLFPVAIGVPPAAAVYQLIVPELAVALKFTVPLPQRAPSFLAVKVGGAITEAITGNFCELQAVASVTRT